MTCLLDSVFGGHFGSHKRTKMVATCRHIYTWLKLTKMILCAGLCPGLALTGKLTCMQCSL